MPSAKVPSRSPSPARWLLVLAGLGAAAALVWLVVSWVRHREAPRNTAKVVPSATAPVRRPPPLPVARRPRAGVGGHVADPAGAAIAGATVCVWATVASGLTTAQAETPRCTATDAKGAYAVEDLFPATPLFVTAGAPRSVPQRYRGPEGDLLYLRAGEQRRDVDFVLRQGGVELKGSVSDVTGGVVAGAVVASDGLVGAGRAVARTDDKGNFTLWVEPGPVALTATATGYAPGNASGQAPGHFFAIHLIPGATLVGRAVLAGTTTPVSDAQIDAIQVEGGGMRGKARTDDEGRFKVEGLTPGRYRIEATAESLEGYSTASLTLGMGETSQAVVVEMDPAFIVRGRVIDKETGKPCGGGVVIITDDRQNEYSQALIEPDGWARMASVIPGTYKVDVQCQGHVKRDDFPPIVVKDQDVPDQTWEVDEGMRVRVAVVDGAGKPVEAARVIASSRTGGPSSVAEHVEPDGAFLLAGLTRGDYEVSVASMEGGRADQKVTLDEQREVRLRIELPATGTIDGVVEDEDRRPIANVHVNAQGPGSAGARSADDGTFTLTGLPAGEYEVQAAEAFDGEGSAQRRSAKVVVRAPGRANARVTVARRDGFIEGRVTDGDGRAATDAFLDFIRTTDGSNVVPRYDGNRAPVVTDTDGRFKIERLEPGEYNLRAYRRGGGEGTALHVKVGTRDVAVRLATGASISGTLTSAIGVVERFHIYASNRQSSFFRGDFFFHSGGAFTLTDLPAGDYEISAHTPNGMGRARLTLAEGEQKKDVAVTLVFRGAIEGRMVNERGAPISGMRVMVAGVSEMPLQAGAGPGKPVTDHEGRFRLEGVLNGSWTLRAVMIDPEGAEVEPVAVPVESRGDGTTDVGTIRVSERIPER